MGDRLDDLARDGNVDIEDVRFVLARAQADGVIDEAEARVLQAGLRQHGGAFEPAARRYLLDVLAGRNPVPPNRVLLAPHPRGAQPHVYQSRNDVVALQEALGRLGHLTSIDGDYGPATARSVAAAQAAAGLPTTGLLDSATLVAVNGRLDLAGQPLLDPTPRAHIRPDAIVAVRHGDNTADIRALQAGLARLGEHMGVAGLVVDASGVFGEETEAALAALQQRAYLPSTGIADEATLDALNAALQALGLDPVRIEPAGEAAQISGAELHFYPSAHELRVYVFEDGDLLDTYPMVGGNPVERDDPDNPLVDYNRTPAGTYEVVEISPHAFNSWSWSYVPYGAELRLADDEIDFRDGRGAWRRATGPQGVFAGRNPPPLDRDAYLDADGRVLPRWVYNDFGHLRARLRSLRTGKLQGHMIHSSPDLEETDAYFQDTAGVATPEQALALLHWSHGCEHIHPRDFDDMVARGYLRQGTRFVVHGYDESFGAST